ncbi:hypothetical protein BURK1_01441 [Burkholderiales bacterium]|nr:hypothetical protein BURK1_01441 [Burkholderiales bacterium]
MTLRLAASLVLTPLLAACAAFGPRLVAPEVTAAGVRDLRLALPEVRMTVDLVLANPNAVDVPLEALVASVSLEGERVAEATLAAPVMLPANGTATVTLAARGDAAATLAGVGRAIGSGRTLRYEVAGEATLGDGRRFAFRRRGETGAGRP